MPDGRRGISQCSVIGPILFVTYIQDIPDHLAVDSLLFAEDAKLIGLRSYHKILQSFSNSYTIQDLLRSNPRRTKIGKGTEFRCEVFERPSACLVLKQLRLFSLN